MTSDRSRRRARAVGLAAALAVAGLALSAPAALAEDAIPAQPYVDVTGLAELKAQGFDGAGVTIALIDSPVDLTVPELAGADITVHEPCPGIVYPPGAAAHGTAVLSLLADQAWGWAPKAKYIVYPFPARSGAGGGAGASVPQECLDAHHDALAYSVNLALNDRADLINISLDAGGGWDNYALARAALTNVPVVAGAGNGVGLNGTALGQVTSLSQHNGVVSVGANDLATGVRARYSEYGYGLTVMAPGGPLTVRAADASGALSALDPAGQGTSFAAPMVTGALALAKQRWPQATGNQLVASLIATAKGSGGWNAQEGYGNVSPRGLIANDPAQYPRDNPLMAKDFGDEGPGPGPTAQEVADYRNGTVDPTSLLGDDDYLYCGTDPLILRDTPPDKVVQGRSPCNAVNGLPPTTTRPAATATAAAPVGTTAPSVGPTSSPAAAPTTSFLTPPLIGGIAAAVIIVAALIAFLVIRSRRRTVPAPPTASPGPPWPAPPLSHLPPPAPPCYPQAMPQSPQQPPPYPGAPTTDGGWPPPPSR